MSEMYVPLFWRSGRIEKTHVCLIFQKPKEIANDE